MSGSGRNPLPTRPSLALARKSSYSCARGQLGTALRICLKAWLPFLAQQCDIRIERVPYAGTSAWAIIRNLAFTARLRADVIHVTGDTYYCALAVQGRRCVLTIHDLVSLVRLHGAKRRLVRLLWYSLPLRWAAHVTAVSPETKRQASPGVSRCCDLDRRCSELRFGDF